MWMYGKIVRDKDEGDTFNVSGGMEGDVIECDKRWEYIVFFHLNDGPYNFLFPRLHSSI